MSETADTPQTDPAPRSLEFADEPGSARSKWVAGLIALALIGWMGSGYVLPAPPEDEAEPVARTEAVSVAVRDSRAETVTRVFTAEGQAQPDRRATLRSETGGDVAELLAEKGDFLEAGAVIARLNSREQEARIAQAREEQARAQREFDNAQTLLERGVATTDRVAQARATLASAEAALTQAEEAAEAAVIRAPFAGRLDALDLDQGAFVAAGTEIGTLLDTDPLSIVIQVPQQALARISEGQEAQVSFITGQERQGRVAYVSQDAQAETRTFRAEITVPNPDGQIASGLSVQVRIPTGEMSAHFISPAILSLDTDGRLGVKTVDDADRVVFHEVILERAQTDGVWVSGLPDAARLITIGQGFVSDGEVVAPRPEGDLPNLAEVEAPTPDAPAGGGAAGTGMGGDGAGAGGGTGDAPAAAAAGQGQADAAGGAQEGDGDAAAGAGSADAAPAGGDTGDAAAAEDDATAAAAPSADDATTTGPEGE